MSGSSESYVQLTIAPDPGDLTLQLASLAASEELGRPFLIELAVFATKAQTDLTALLGCSVTVGISKAGSGKRYLNGIVSRAAFEGLDGGMYSYRLELRPWIWLLSRTRDCKIYQNMTVYDIITDVFRKAGFSDFADKRQMGSGGQTLEYCVQYDETKLAFVTRLMERYGLYYYFTFSDGQHTLNIADDPGSHQSIRKSLKFVGAEREMRMTEANVSHLTSEHSLLPGSVVLNDYKFQTPTADLKVTSKKVGNHKHAGFEVYDYPGLYTEVAVGQTLADVRMQEFTMRSAIMSGTTNSREISAGARFTLEGAPDQGNGDYIVITSTCALQLAESSSNESGGMIDTYRCAMTAMKADKPFRLDAATPWPVMRGPQTAKVVGERGEEITTDSFGRIKVKFPWDRDPGSDETSSCWIRVAQLWAGASWGAMFIPRIGQEVVVEFLDGDPDRPLVTGCVYNGSNGAPYALPDNKTRMTIKSNSSKGGNGSNELWFEDKAGSEEVFLHAQKDYRKEVLHDETVTITNDTTTTVKEGNRSVTVSQGNNTLTVSSGNNSETVSKGNNSLTVSQGNDSTTVSAGDHTITVSVGSSTISAGQEITLKATAKITLQVGGTSIVLSADGITISAPKIDASSQMSMSLSGGASMSLNAAQIAIN